MYTWTHTQDTQEGVRRMYIQTDTHTPENFPLSWVWVTLQWRSPIHSITKQTTVVPLYTIGAGPAGSMWFSTFTAPHHSMPHTQHTVYPQQCHKVTIEWHFSERSGEGVVSPDPVRGGRHSHW